MKKLSLVLAVGLLAAAPTFAQKNDYSAYKWGTGWYLFEEYGASVAASEALTNKGAWGLGVDDSLLKFTAEPDPSGSGEMHYRYKQLYKTYPVEDAQFILHTTAQDSVTVATSGVVTGLNIDVSNPISEADALVSALTEIGAVQYAVDDVENQFAFQQRMQDPSAVETIRGKLVIGRLKGGGPFAGCYRFGWRFHIEADTPFNVWKVLVDAQTGAVLEAVSDLQEGGVCQKGSVQSNYNGFRANDMETFKCSSCNDWQLTSCQSVQTTKQNSVLWDDDNVWTANSERSTTSAHWVATRAWDYFKNWWGRNGYDGVGSWLRVKANQSYTNAYWDGNGNIFLGAASGKPLNCYDILGHEYTHGITQHTAGLVYQGQSGALNESFSDIFGTMFERAMNGTTTWTLGEDANFIIRDMSNPNSHAQPATFGGAYWVNTSGCTPSSSNDNCGVHTNSGVQNHWFYKLSNYIGIDKAAMISWHSLNLYLQPHATYDDAKMGAIIQAKKLYGKCSNEARKTIQAWQEVNVWSGINGISFRDCLTQIDPATYAQAPITRCVEVGPKPAGVTTVAVKSGVVRIHPNPAVESFSVTIPDGAQDNTLVVLNALGQEAFRQVFKGDHTVVSVQNLPVGTYHVIIRNAAQVYTERVVVSH